LQHYGKVDVILMLRESERFLTDITLDVRFVLTPMVDDKGPGNIINEHKEE